MQIAPHHRSSTSNHKIRKSGDDNLLPQLEICGNDLGWFLIYPTTLAMRKSKFQGNFNHHFDKTDSFTNSNKEQ